MNILLLIAILWLILGIIALIIARRSYQNDILNPIAIIVYFSYLPMLQVLIFGLDESKISIYIFNRISHLYHDFRYVVYASLILLTNYICVIVGVLFYKKYCSNGISLFYLFFPKKIVIANKYLTYRLGLFSLAIGFVFYLYLIIANGGLSNIWVDIDSRTEVLSGQGYILKLYMFLVQIGSAVVSIFLLKNRKYIRLIIMILFSSFLLVSFGSRSNVLLMFFSFAITMHYCNRKFKSLFNIKTFIAFLVIISFLLSVVLLRKNDALEYYTSYPSEFVKDISNSFEENFVMRVGRLERDTVVIGYFTDNEVWYGSSLLALFSAPIPRQFYPEKPPIDQGAYIVKMAYGLTVNPPERLEQLPKYSWPSGYIETFMNFHIFGVLFFSFLSGLFFASLHRFFVLKTQNILFVSFYGLISFNGAPDFSVLRIVYTSTNFLYLLALILIFNCFYMVRSIFRS